jgi:hypothetical protein
MAEKKKSTTAKQGPEASKGVTTESKTGKKSTGKAQEPPFLVIGRVAFSRQQLLAIAGGILILVCLGVWLLVDSPQQDAPSAARQADVTGTKPLAPQPATVSTRPAAAPGSEANGPSIKQVRLFPPQPTIQDTLKAEVSTDFPEPLTYTYQWKVNERVMPEATGEALKLSAFRKRDLITVTVTPYAGKVVGFAVESPVIAVHSAPPSLEMKEFSRQPRKVGDPIELQLAGTDPDGDAVTFSLEPPLVPGMSIDSATGKITWTIPPEQKGTIRFGAAASDPDQTKVTKIFEMVVE